jgi:hypothetical protein
MEYNNQTNGRFDITKEAEIVANIVVGDLADSGLIPRGQEDRAVEIASARFLAHRRAADATVSDIEQESSVTAQAIIQSLVDAGIINTNDYERAFEIAAEEILVRRSMESLR